MRLKKTALIFIATLLLFTLLIVSRYRTTLIPYIVSFAKTTILQKNSSANQPGRHKSAEVEKIIRERLIELETNPNEITSIFLLEDSTIEISAPVPRGRPMEWIIWSLSRASLKAGYYVSDCYYQESPFSCTMTLVSSRKSQPSVKVVLNRSKRYFSSAAKMAIIITDFAYTTDPTVNSFFSFPEPLTITLLSSKKLAVSSADIARENHKEIVLLLPMEPLGTSYRDLRNEAIMLHYPPEKIRHLIDNATEKIPFYTGFTNLGGSRILQDSRIMKIILSIAADKKGYFLFDLPQHRTNLTALARKYNVPYRYIDISLDSSSSASSSVTDSLKRAALIAQKKGSVVFSAHPTEQLLSAATKLLPYFQHNGIELVTASELVNHSQP